MAKNWTIGEATQEFMKGNKETITDIGKRFPLLSYLLAGALSGNVGATEALLKSLPDNLTCNKVNGYLKNDVVEETEEADEAVETEETNEDVESENTDYDNMSSKELYGLIKSRNLQKMMKEDFGNKWNKANYVACLKKADGLTSDEADETDEDSEYDGMSALELFKECKKRGIKVPPKKAEEFYIKKLIEDDKAKEAEDDWGDEDSEVEVKQKPKQNKSKPAPKVDEDDEDDDWDI